MIFYIIVLLFLWHFSMQGTFAASVSLSNPTTENITDFEQGYELDVNLKINTANDTKYYLRGVFYKSGTTKYCGLTWNGSSWYNGPFSAGDGWKNLPTVTISSDSAELRLKAKLDKDDNDCNTSGEYNFKVQRYTQKGNSVLDQQNEQKIIAELPKLTPSEKPTVKITPTTATFLKPKSDPSPIKPATPIPSPLITKLVKIDYTPAITPDVTIIVDISETATVAGLMKKKEYNFILLPLFSGIVLIFSAAFLSFRKIYKLMG